MKTYLLAFMVLLLVSCSSCAGRQYPNQAPTMVDVAVVRLTSVDADGKAMGHCTGWKLDENRIVTAGHCCDYEVEADPIAILLGAPGESKSEIVPMFTMEGEHALPGATATVIKMDKEHDVCVLKGKMRGAPIRLAPHDPAKGEHVFTAGYPHSTFLISEGLWSGRDDDGQGISSVAIWGGASGSPLMDSEGRAVGVLIASYRGFDSQAFSAPLEWLRVLATTTRSSN